MQQFLIVLSEDEEDDDDDEHDNEKNESEPPAKKRRGPPLSSEVQKGVTSADGDGDDGADDDDDELLKIEDVIEQAFNAVVDVVLCERVRDSIHQDEVRLMEQVTKNLAHVRVPTKMKLEIPFFVKRKENHFVMKWLPFNANINLSRHVKKNQVDFLKYHSPAFWVCEEQGHESRKEEWIQKMNAMPLQPNTFLTKDGDCSRFVLMEYSYFGMSDGYKSLSGLAMILCELDAENCIKLVDVANIKLSCSSSNRVYGSIFKFLDKYYNLPFLVYTPQGFLSKAMYSNCLFPWSKHLLKCREVCFNLITCIKLNTMSSDEDARALCCDADRHSLSCALCNVTSLYRKLATNQFQSRGLNSMIDNTLMSPNLEDSAAHPMFIECGDTVYVTYSKHNPLLRTCQCKNKTDK